MSFLCVIVITGCKELITFSSCISLLFRPATIIFIAKITLQVLGSEKTVDISRRYLWFPAKWRLRIDYRNSILMTCHCPDLHGLWHVISMEFLSSFFRLHFPGKPMVASGNVGRFVRRPVFEVGFNQNQNPLQDQSYLISKSYFWIKRFWITAHLPLPYANILAQGRNIRVSEIKVRMICLRRPFTIRRRPPLKKIWGFVVSLYSARLEDEVQITFVK